MGKISFYISLVLTLLGVLASFAGAACPNLLDTDPLALMGVYQRPYGTTENTLKPDPNNARQDVAAKVSQLTRRFNNLVKKTFGTDMKFGEKVMAEIQEARSDFNEEIEGTVRKYEEKIKALNVGIVKSKESSSAVGGGANTGLDGKERESKENSKGFLGQLLESAKVQFYQHKNLTGAYPIIEVGNPEQLNSCQNLDTLRKDGSAISSLQTFGTCVRLFQGRGCTSPSVAVYPGSDPLLLLNPILAPITSVGPCYKSEFDYSSFTQTPQGVIATKDVHNYREIPALIAQNMDPCGSRTIQDSMPAILYARDPRYISDCSNRTAWLYWRITKGDINCEDFSSSLNQSSTWSSMEKESGDMMGFVMSPNFGGCSQEPRNIFPQSLRHYDAWNEVVEKITDFLLDYPSSTVDAQVELVYPDKRTKRPHGMYWSLDFGKHAYEEGRLVYGYIPN